MSTQNETYKPRKKFKLADSTHSDVDLTQYANEIVDVINRVAPGKHPIVTKSYYSTDLLTHSEAVMIGRELSKIKGLNSYGKEVTIYRLFEGKTYESEESATPIKNLKEVKENRKGGRMR